MTATQTSSRLRRNRIRLAIGAAALASLGAAGPLHALPAFPIPVNLPPVPSFTATPNPVAAGDLATFNGSASRDVDGSITKYEWDTNGDGIFEVRSATISSYSRRYTTPGTYSVKLRVTDNRGATGTKAISFRVHAKPVALLTADRAVPNVGDVVGYRATGSYDPDPGGYIRAYYWDMDGNGTFERYTGTNPYVTTSFPTPGNHRLSVRVYDALLAYSDASLIVRVNRRPTAVISATPNPAVVNQQVMLSGAASTDDRSIVKYEWDLDGNGTYETNTGTSKTTTTMFSTLGQVKVGLQVTDDDGATDQSIATISVNPAPVRDTKAPLIRISPATVKMIFGTATFRVTCPVDELSCSTKLTLRGRYGALKGKVLGSAREMIPGGETLEITVPLSTKAKKAIRKFGQLKSQATAVARDDAGNTGTVRKFVTIKK